VILSAADWDLLARARDPWPKPRRDLVATDGEKPGSTSPSPPRSPADIGTRPTSARPAASGTSWRRLEPTSSSPTNPYLDGSATKLPALARRQPGEPHPYVVGNESVKRYLTVAYECAQAGLLRLK